MGTHYRSPINYSEIQLESASDRIFYIYQVQYYLSLDKHNEGSDSVFHFVKYQFLFSCIKLFHNLNISEVLAFASSCAFRVMHVLFPLCL